MLLGFLEKAADIILRTELDSLKNRGLEVKNALKKCNAYHPLMLGRQRLEIN